jgi:hypothetical protein
VAEAAPSDPGNKDARFHSAAGSAREPQHALRQAIAWRHVTARDAERALGLVRRIVAILWKITTERSAFCPRQRSRAFSNHERSAGRASCARLGWASGQCGINSVHGDSLGNTPYVAANRNVLANRQCAPRHCCCYSSVHSVGPRARIPTRAIPRAIRGTTVP